VKRLLVGWMDGRTDRP